MALVVEDQGLHDMSFLWDPSNSDNSGESKENMKPLNQKKERDEALMNKKRNRDNGEGKDEKCREFDHELHIWTERERRKKMRNMFAGLHALLPHLPSKADKSTIVDEAVIYIKNLQQTLEKLEKQKQEKLQHVSSILGCDSSSNAIMGTGTSNALSVPGPQPAAFDKTWAAPNMVLNIFGDEAQFSICAAHKPGLMTTIAFVLEKYKIEIISATVSSNGNASIVQAHGKRASHQFLDANSLDEIYKQAAGEIMLWVA
ncbi:Transcription factor bHLH95, partial [Mucuna pruriens]